MCPMGYNWAKKKMKKVFLICLVVFGFAFAANAQVGTSTKAVPISNGCGSETVPGSRTLGKVGTRVDAVITGTSVQTQRESCDQHDKDYYNGVDKNKADSDFKQRSPVMGKVVTSFEGMSNNSYNEAQKDRETSRQLQPTWEKENKQCLDGNNYRVTPKN